MSEAPERIWAGDFDHRDNGHCVSGSRSVSTYTQYLRADIAASLQEQVETLTKERDQLQKIADSKVISSRNLHTVSVEAAEAERDRWKGEYLNACRDAASFSDDLVKAEAERDRLAAEVTLLRAVARRYLDVTQEYFSDAEYDRNGCLAEAAAKLVVLLYSETARAALASVKE